MQPSALAFATFSQKNCARRKTDAVVQSEALSAFIEELKRSPIAIKTEAANEQHYEVPTGFFQLVLGPRIKYSSGYWPREDTTFAESEEAMLALSCERAQLTDGQDVLELGCGWGSLTLWMAEKSRTRALRVSRIPQPKRRTSTPRPQSRDSRTSASSPPI
jgi:cyclopropane-fatty-acyl-phospholipid synthase